MENPMKSLVALSMLALANAASAGPIIQTVSFQSGGSVVGDDLLDARSFYNTQKFKKFDSSLGVLKSVTFTLDSTLEATLASDLEADETVAPHLTNPFSLVVGPNLRLRDSSTEFGKLFFGADLLSMLLELDYNSATGELEAQTSGNQPRNASKTMAPPNDLSFFIGASGAQFDAEFENRMTVENAEPPSTTLTGNATWSGGLKLEYAYEPVTVPEPGTLALTGLAILIGVRRARRHTV
jgi:hypothetical protein